jgi:hypothetical protein
VILAVVFVIVCCCKDSKPYDPEEDKEYKKAKMKSQEELLSGDDVGKDEKDAEGAKF